ncbi:MAG: carbohydrate ABC transporter permease [Lachnospiraceae bacterium]
MNVKGKNRVRKEKKKKHNAETRRAKISSGIFLAPSIVGVSIFFLVPFLVVIYYAVVDNPISKQFVFFNNFIKVFENAAFQLAAYNTFRFSVVAVPLVVILSLVFAFFLERAIPFKSQIRTFLLSPMMVPIASVVLIWQVLFHYNGLVNEVLMVFGEGKIDWFKSSQAQIVVIILFIWKNLGYNMILFMAAISSIPRDILEVAWLESASNWQIFWYIKIRYLSSTILFVTILSLINSFKVFREIYLLTGDYPYDSLYMLQHFMNNTFRSLDYQRLSAAAIIMSVFMVIVIGIMFLVESYVGRDL